MRSGDLLAFVSALLWAIHPLQTEAVVYVTQRTEVMVGFFYLTTLYGSLRYWAAEHRSARFAWLLLATVACAAGMACKETMLAAPVLVLLFERTFSAGSFARAVRNSWALYVGLFATWGLLVALNISGPRSESAGFDLGIPLLDYWCTQAKVLFMYLKLVFWPWPLVIHYEMRYISFSDAWPWVIGALGLMIATGVMLWRRSCVGFAGAWTFAILLPTLVVPISTEIAAERRMYLPLAAIVPLVVAGFYLSANSIERRRCAEGNSSDRKQWSTLSLIGLAGVIVVIFEIVGIRRLSDYRDQVTLWQTTVENEPDDSLAHNNLGSSYYHAHRIPDAISEYRRTIELNPQFADAYDNLGSALYRSGACKTRSTNSSMRFN